MTRLNWAMPAIAVLVCSCALTVCRHHSPTEPAAVASDAPEPTPPFDPQEFLCRFTGGPAGESRVGGPLAGRRHTPAEKAAAREMISAALRSFGLEPEERPYEWGTAIDRRYISETYMENGYGDRGVNLTAALPATVPSDTWTVVGAHYDTVETSPGADDNASGVTAVLLVAEELVRVPARDTNVMFVFFDQEEIGLVGSCLFAERLRSDGVDFADLHNIDMVGWDSDHDRAVELTFCNGRNAGFDRATEAYFMELYARAAVNMAGDPDGPVGDLSLRHSCRSDHVPFGWFGYRAVHVAEEFSGNDMCPHYHQRQDTCDTLNYGYLRSVAALVAAAVTIQVM